MNPAWACLCIIKVLMSIKQVYRDLEDPMCLDWRSDDILGICSVVWASYRCNDSEGHELCPFHLHPSLSDFHSCATSYLLFSWHSCSGEDYQLVSKVYPRTRRLSGKSDSSQVVLWYESLRSCNLCVYYMVETLSAGLSQSSKSKWSICLPGHTPILVVFHQFFVLKIQQVLMIDRPRSNLKAFWTLLD